MTRVALITLNGVSFAGLLFLVASGFTLVFSLMRVLNLAHGAFYLWGGYLGLTVINRSDNFWLGLVAAGLMVAVGGAVAERVLFRRVAGEPLKEILLTLGLAFILADLALVVFGGYPAFLQPPKVLQGSMPLFGIGVPRFRVALIVGAAIVAALLWWLLSRTRIGATIRAGADDRQMLSSLGVNVRLVYTAMFIFGAFLAGASGVVGGVFLGVTPGNDAEMLLFALVVVVVGGLGSLKGAVVGSLVVGIFYSFGASMFPEFLYFLVFGPMLVILVLRPQGLVGGRT